MEEEIKKWLASLGGNALESILSALITAVIGILVIQLIQRVVRAALGRSRLEKASHSLIISLIQVTLYVLLGTTVASALGINITGVVALASVLTLAVSLSLQNMLTNVFGGFTVLTTRPFRSGDFVEIAGQSGTVLEISMTYTRLTTPDNKVISIPNSAVVGAQIVNYSANESRRIEITVSASYGAPTQKVLDALVQAATVDNALLDPAPFAGILNYGESAIEYVLRLWVKTPDYWDVFFTVNQRIKTVFDEQGIEMTYPHLNVHINQ